MAQGTCSVDGCDTPTEARGWCSKHYQRWQNNGDVHVRLRPANGEAVEAFRRLAGVETDDCVIWPHGRNKGYGIVNWEGRPRMVHQLALELRDHDRRGRHACHVPGIGCVPLCMNYRHLYWGTQRENQADRLIDGTSNRGELNGAARLTAPQVTEIRERYASGVESHASLAAKFGVSGRSIANIVRRETWAHVP